MAELPKVQNSAIMKVGDLKKKLIDLPDDALIMCQVVAADGTVWNMGGDAGTAGSLFVIQLSHPDVKSLPGIGGYSRPGEYVGFYQKVKNAIEEFEKGLSR